MILMARWRYYAAILRCCCHYKLFDAMMLPLMPLRYMMPTPHAADCRYVFGAIVAADAPLIIIDAMLRAMSYAKDDAAFTFTIQRTI